MDVKDAMSLKDGTVEINLYNIPNPACRRHCLVGPNMVWVTGPDFAARPDQPLAQHDGGW